MAAASASSRTPSARCPLVPVVQPTGDFSTPDDGLEYVNPAALVAFDNLRARSTNILGNIEGRLRITPSLSFTSRVGVDLINLKEDQFQSRQVGGSYASSADGVAKKGFSAADAT